MVKSSTFRYLSCGGKDCEPKGIGRGGLGPLTATSCPHFQGREPEVSPESQLPKPLGQPDLAPPGWVGQRPGWWGVAGQQQG